MRIDPITARPWRPMAGFTVIELIITVAVLAILVAIATPSFRELSVNNRTTAATNNLLADLALARNEAVKTARVAYVTATGGNWGNGWMVWVDADGNGSRGSEEPVLREQDAVDSPDMADENTFDLGGFSGAAAGGAAIAELAFGPLGQIRTPDDGARFSICRPDGDAVKSAGIRVDISGRAQSVRDLRTLNLGCS